MSDDTTPVFSEDFDRGAWHPDVRAEMELAALNPCQITHAHPTLGPTWRIQCGKERDHSGMHGWERAA
jgi:hypothetical protein